MPLYAAYAPRGPLTLEACDEAALVPQGFSKPAFFFGPLWLAAKGLWRALLGWTLAMAALAVMVVAFGLPPIALLAVEALFALYLGVEAPALRGAALTRSGRPLVDVLAAADEQVALKALFADWSGLRQTADAPTRAASEPPRPPAGGSIRQPVLGLFPEPGGRA
jgi:anti-sigma-K factor RskA